RARAPRSEGHRHTTDLSCQFGLYTSKVIRSYICRSASRYVYAYGRHWRFCGGQDGELICLDEIFVRGHRGEKTRPRGGRVDQSKYGLAWCWTESRWVINTVDMGRGSMLVGPLICLS